MAVGQVAYTHWCDGEGKVIDDGTVSRLGETTFRWTAAEPTLRWIRENAHGLEAEVVDVTEQTAALALQGPTSRDVLRACVDGDVAALKYFRVMSATIRGIPVEISRTGYTGDLGYEIWLAAEQGRGGLGRAHGGGTPLRHHPHGHLRPRRGADRGGPRHARRRLHVVAKGPHRLRRSTRPTRSAWAAS